MSIYEGQSNENRKDKGIPITGHEGPRGMWMQGSTYSQPRQKDEEGWLVLRSTAFTPGEIYRYSFYRRLSGPQDQSGHERCEEKSPPLRHLGRPARSQVPCHLSHNENRTPATKWQWNLFYSKVIARSVNTFILLGDVTINSTLVERGRSLMDPQPHPFLHFLIQMEPMSMNVFLQVAKNVEVTRGKIWAVRSVFKCFPAKSLKLIPHQIGSMWMGIIMQKDDSIRQQSRTFWLYNALQRVCIALHIACDSKCNTANKVTVFDYLAREGFLQDSITFAQRRIHFF